MPPLENKDVLYVKALEHIGNKYEFIPAATQAWYLQAQWYVSQAQRYDPQKGNTNRDAYLKAMSICDKVIVQKDSSEGKLNCQNLVREITRIEMNLQTEKVNVPGQPFRTLLTWRNFTRLHFQNDENGCQNQRSQRHQYLGRRLLGKTGAIAVALRSFSQTLPDTKDYQKHAN